MLEHSFHLPFLFFGDGGRGLCSYACILHQCSRSGRTHSGGKAGEKLGDFYLKIRHGSAGVLKCAEFFVFPERGAVSRRELSCGGNQEARRGGEKASERSSAGSSPLELDIFFVVVI